MEAAGLTFGVMNVFPACLQGYDVLVSMKNFSKESSTLYWKLRTQELRLLIWGQLFGLPTELLNSTSVEAFGSSSLQPSFEHPVAVLRLVHGVLDNIKDILCDAQKLSLRYGLHICDSSSDVDTVWTMLWKTYRLITSSDPIPGCKKWARFTSRHCNEAKVVNCQTSMGDS
jgi:Prion-inhibition and propagation